VDKSRLDLLFHPVRYRIIRHLSGDELTTYQLAAQMPDVPRSSIYRHLKFLLDAQFVVVTDSREVNGITEKVYGVSPDNVHQITTEEFAQLSRADHINNVRLFAMSLMQDVTNALEATPQDEFSPNSMTYREYTFYATEDNMKTLRRTILQMLRNAEKAPDLSDESRKYKFSIVTYETPKNK
jgi:DNA-binding transcriptional ArsR family regulator